MPEQLWKELSDFVQEAGVKTTPIKTSEKDKIVVSGGLTNS